MILDVIARAFEKLRTVQPATVPLPGVEFHDRRKFAMQAHGPKRDWPVRTRPMKRVTGVCLHQAAGDLGELVERYDSVGANVCLTRGRKVILLHDWDREGQFANGWNTATVSIEVSGLYAGVEGRLSTVWDNPATAHREQPHVFTDDLAATLVDTIVWIHDDANRRGANIRVIVAHRQSSGTRPSDPGQGIWRGGALPAAERLGIKTAPETVLDDGARIPEEWDPTQVGVKY